MSFARTNSETEARGGHPATGEPAILGTEQASLLGTDSFLLKAVLSDTPRVLAQAALSGAVDELEGLRERMMAGLPLG